MLNKLVRENQQLQEETIAQRQIIRLDKIRAEQESREFKEQSTQLMQDLEQEKLQLEEDIDKMRKNEVTSAALSPFLSPPSLSFKSRERINWLMQDWAQEDLKGKIMPSLFSFSAPATTSSSHPIPGSASPIPSLPGKWIVSVVSHE